MNFNASRNVGQQGGIRKAKRVSDVAAMGAPSPTPQFGAAPAYNQAAPAYNQAASVYNQAFAPAAPAVLTPPYQEGILLDGPQNFGSPAPAANFSYGYPQSPIASPAQLGSMLQQPIVQGVALEYGHQLAAQGRAAVQEQLGKYVPVSRLRYYFAVDTRYVLRKLLLIVFPFTHKEWMLKYDQDSPVQPRFELNAPDLYIPAMGYVTYVLLAGFMLGLQHRFSPEQISIQASSALAYIIFEMIMYLGTLYVSGAGAGLRTLDLLAFAGYKYVVMIGALLAALALGRAGYYCGLLYTSLALSYFLVKTLRVQLLTGSQASSGAYGYPAAHPYADALRAGAGTKRRLYFLLFVAVAQPLLSWWLTYHLLPAEVLDISIPDAVSPAR